MASYESLSDARQIVNAAWDVRMARRSDPAFQVFVPSGSPEIGVYPWGINGPGNLAAAETLGTVILVLKNGDGPLRLQIDCYPWGLHGGDIHPTDAWVISPSGQQLWYGEGTEGALRDKPRQTRNGAEFQRLDLSIPTQERGLFRVVFGSFALLLYQTLTDGLPEAMLVQKSGLM
jgi:hypothetical protein